MKNQSNLVGLDETGREGNAVYLRAWGDYFYHTLKLRQSETSSLRDVEVETLLGVILGYKHIPINRVGAYAPGGKYPLLASAHMGILTPKVAGVKHVIACAPPYEGKPAAAIVAPQAMADADKIYVLGGIQATALMFLGASADADNDAVTAVSKTTAILADFLRQKRA